MTEVRTAPVGRWYGSVPSMDLPVDRAGETACRYGDAALAGLHVGAMPARLNLTARNNHRLGSE